MRLGSRIGVSMPWWLAWIPLLVWVAGLVVVGSAWLLVMGCVVLVKLAAVLAVAAVGLVRSLRPA